MYATNNNIEYFYHEGYFAQFPNEGKRMMFILSRDGIGGLGDFVLQTYIQYRLALRNKGFAHDKTFRREYIKSCIDFRNYLKQHSANAYGFDNKNSIFAKAIRTIRQRSV